MKSLFAMRAGEEWIVRAKIAPPQGCVMPISSCITLVVTAILRPAIAPRRGSHSAHNASWAAYASSKFRGAIPSGRFW